MASNMSLPAQITEGKGFKFANTNLHETKYMRISLSVKYVPKPDGTGLHHAELSLTQEKKKPTETWEQAQKSVINLSTEEPNKSLNKLVETLKGIRELYAASRGNIMILEGDEARLVESMGGSQNLRLLSQLSDWFQTPTGQTFLQQIDVGELDSLLTSVKHTKNRKELVELEKLIDGTVKEQEFWNWIDRNAWVFGTEYIRKYNTRKIGIHSVADFIVESLDGYTDLIELKGSGVALFTHDPNHDCYYPSRDLSQVIGQAVHYIRVMEDHKAILKADDDLQVLKPRVKIVIGRSKTMNPKEKEALRLLNATLHGIEIITYDEIVSRARKIVSIYEGESKTMDKDEE